MKAEADVPHFQWKIIETRKPFKYKVERVRRYSTCPPDMRSFDTTYNVGIYATRWGARRAIRKDRRHVRKAKDPYQFATDWEKL